MVRNPSLEIDQRPTVVVGDLHPKCLPRNRNRLSFRGHSGSVAAICVATGVARKIEKREGSRADRNIVSAPLRSAGGSRAREFVESPFGRRLKGQQLIPSVDLPHTVTLFNPVGQSLVGRLFILLDANICSAATTTKMVPRRYRPPTPAPHRKLKS